MRRAWYRDKGGSRAAESVPAGGEEEGGGGGAERGSEQPVGDLARVRSGEDRDELRIERSEMEYQMFAFNVRVYNA